ncbi:MAG: T9SS type A sorting domain-containing protein, partial [candidate division WOR-3 bacterium]
IYAAGMSWGGESWYDIVIIGLTDQGSERWVYRQVGPRDDVIEDILPGPDNNLYAAGYVTENPSEPVRMFEVMSIDTAGTELWVYTDFQGGCYDLGLGYDQNLYAAGYTFYLDHTKYTALSLDLAGNGRWVYRYMGQGPLNSARSIVCPRDGNIYTTGYENGQLTGMDVAVVGLTAGTGTREGDEHHVAGRVRAPTLFKDRIVLNLRAEVAAPVRFRLYDLDGSRVLSRTFHRASSELVVDGPDLAQLPAGVYLATVSVPGRSASSLKLVKQ